MRRHWGSESGALLLLVVLLSALWTVSAAAQDDADGEPVEVDETGVEDELDDGELDEIDEDPLEGDTIVVTGSRTRRKLADTPVATEVITRQEIEDSGAQDLSQVLEGKTGIEVVHNFAGASIQMQGLDSEYVLVLINGERLLGRRRGNVLDIERIPVESIEQIEIVKGSSSSLYGSDAIGGVINILTRDPLEPVEAEAQLSVGGFGLLDNSGRIGVRLGDYDLEVHGGFHQADGFDLNPADLSTTGADVQSWNVGGMTRYRISPNYSVRAQVNFQNRFIESVDANATGAVFNTSTLTEDLSSTVGGELFFGEASLVRVTGTFSLFRDQFLQDQRGATALDQYQDTSERMGQVTAQLDQPLGDDHLLTVGVEGAMETVDSERLSEGGGERQRGAIFVQDEWAVLDEPVLTLVPGVRVDFDSQFGVNPTPKIAARYDPTDQIIVRSSIGMGFRAPTFREQLLLFENPSVGYLIEGNPDLEPETSIGINASIEYQPARALGLSVSVFRNDIDNLIFTELSSAGSATEPQRFTYTNISQAITQGVETHVRFAPWAGMTADAGYALTDTLDKRLDRPLEGRALHRANMRVTQRHAGTGLSATLRATFVGSRPFFRDEDGDGVDERIRAAPHTLLDARLGWDAIEHATVFVGATNLFDAGDHDFLPIRPRTVYGGVTARY